MSGALRELDELERTRAVFQSAREAASAASTASDVVVRTADGVEAMAACERLLNEVWNGPSWRPPIPRDALRALVHAGNYLGAAYRGDELVGACLGFFGHPDNRSLHSHLAGVSPGDRGSNVGYALKLHQRAWCLSRGVGLVSWTFDPLVSRNAYFNLGKLKASAPTYLYDFYGPIDDALNNGGPSDRLMASWDLVSARVARAAGGAAEEYEARDAWTALSVGRAGEPVRASRAGGDRCVLVGIPSDIDRVRADQPSIARDWRFALREALTQLLDEGGRIVDFARSAHYVIERTPRREGTS